MRLVLLLAALLSLPAGLLSSSPALACSVCGCGDPLLSTSDPAAINGTFRLQADSEYLRMDAGSDGRPGFVDRLTQWSFRLNVVARPTRQLSLSATVPVLMKAIRTEGADASVTDSNLTGVGDLEAGARYAVIRLVDLRARRVQELAFSLGTTAPTGAHNATVVGAAGQLSLVDPHGQLGTGAWGPFAGVHYWVDQDRWLGFAAISYRLRTTGSFVDGSRYKFGDALLWSAHGQFRPVPELAFDLGIDGRYAVADRAVEPDGTAVGAVENTGGTVLSAAPGVYVNLAAPFWVFLRGQVPFISRLRGEQSVFPSISSGLQFQLL